MPTTHAAWRRSLTWLIVALIVVILVGGAAWIVHDLFISDQGLEAAIAATDRLDPGWRIEELQAARKPVPDAENAALVVLAVAEKIPKSWPGLRLSVAKLPWPGDPSWLERRRLRRWPSPRNATARPTAAGRRAWKTWRRSSSLPFPKIPAARVRSAW
jgi:hypothetical protein